jgi:iron complex transport system permease protein
MNRKKKIARSFTLLMFLLTVLFALDIAFGSVNIPVRQILNVFTSKLDIVEGASNIVLYFRLPKAIVVLLAGIYLSLSGLQM